MVKKLFIILFLIFVSISSYAVNHLTLTRQEENVIKKMAPYKILFIPGIFDNLNQLGSIVLYPLSIFHHTRDLASFYDLRKILKNEGIEYEYLKINTQRSSIHNGKVITKKIQKSFAKNGKKLIIISHSKGCVDTLHSFVTESKKGIPIEKYIVGWLAITGPFYGSSWTKIVPPPFNTKLKLASTLSSKYLIPYHQRNSKTINSITKKIPVVTLGAKYSGHKKFKNKTPSLFSIANKVIKKTNDGVVSVESSCLPGAKCFMVNHLDHLGPVMDFHPFYSIGVEYRKKLMFNLLEKLF